MNDRTPKYRAAPVPSRGMPKGIPYIVGNEAAERFSFYGMRTILTIFMVQYLHYLGAAPETPISDAAAQENFHRFVKWVYFFPIFGALLADIFTGKYRTIIALSIVYCAGHACLATMGNFGSAESWLIAGLLLIAIGSGGIKPCVSAHVGDQFGHSNSHLVSRVFNYFYFSINLGAFISTLLTPWLLEWYGPHWAFGVPGVLMALATVVFWMGRHKFIHIPARGFPFLKETFSRRGVFAILKLSIIYVFVAVFWALFDQTGSSWVLQAQDMNLHWLGVTWLPSQIQAINPIMILTFIPLFTFIVYPAINRVFTLTPLRKIGIGLFITVGSFAIIALSQQWIDAGERPSIAWQILAYAILTAGEVMVSIVCLEFSYTQAPRTMKSVIMALFLMSVSFGNFFTEIVNRFIQIPNTLAAIDSASTPGDSLRFEDSENRNTRIHCGRDGQFGTEDDITAVFAVGKRISLEFEGRAAAAAAADKLEAFTRANDWTLPLNESGQALIDENKPAGEPQLRYRLVNSRQFRIVVAGSDTDAMTPWDPGYNVSLDPAPVEDQKGVFRRIMDLLKPDEPWLDRQKAKLGIARDDDPDRETIVKRDAFVGGLTKLEGAPYFWFFTWIMLGTAVVFIAVALLYKPREYLQEEAETDAEAETEIH